jgi:hypothetical protein
VPKPFNQPRLTVDQMVAAYQSRRTLVSIAREAKVAVSTVRTMLQSRGIPIRQPGRQRHNMSLGIEKMVELYTEQEMSLYDVGLRAGCSSLMARMLLVDAGVTIRPKGFVPNPPGAAKYLAKDRC